MQLGWKLFRSRSDELIIADRYMYDVAVNIGLTLDWSPDEVVAFAASKLAHIPIPVARVFVRVTPETSLARKDDIPDRSYLDLRLRYYDAIASAFGFTIVDGTADLAENAERICALVRREIALPYVHYVHSNNDDVGGADRVLVAMASHAANPGMREQSAYRVAVSLRRETTAAQLHREQGTPVIIHSFCRPNVSDGLSGVLRTGASALPTALHFLRLFRREQPQVVHVNDLYDFIPAACARLMGIEVVYHIRMFKHGWSAGLLSRIVAGVSSRSISVSNAVRTHYFGTDPASKHLVIHDLARAELMSEGNVTVLAAQGAPFDTHGRCVVAIGRIEPWKGQMAFLDAIALLPLSARESNTFVIVGGSVPGKHAYFAQVKERAESLGVLFLGERSDVPRILANAAVSVHCATEPDPFPGVVVESLLAGTPTVATGAGGVPEMIIDGVTGFLYVPGDVSGLAGVIETLLAEPQDRLDDAAARGRERALHLVDPTVVDAQIIAVYEELTSGVGVPSSPIKTVKE
ncbi:glycosyltransferase [Terrabacter sp. 2TAF16]|uniref:glycosyltransferase n=1 Tax=Terrabacter sp. 2TAF16 TaxID=3233008 RepID=UPI003F9E93B3